MLKQTMGALYQILSYSIGSLFLGIILTVAGVVLMFYIIKSWHRNSTFTPASFIIGGVLTILLSFQMTLLCGAVTIKSYCSDMEDHIDNIVSNIPSTIQFSRGDSQQILNDVSREWPLVGYFVDTANFAGHTSADIAKSMADEMHSYMNKFIFRRILWSLLFIALGAFSVIKTMDVIRKNNRRRSHARHRAYED